MDIAKVRELVELVENSKIDELEITSKDATIRIQKTGVVRTEVVASAPAAQVAAAPAPVPVPEAAAPAASPERATWKEVHSPIVGTFYGAPSPESPAFVSVGDRVSPGQTLCIVEAMKVMNEIEAEFGGVIKEIMVENGSPVEAEAVLFLVDPS